MLRDSVRRHRHSGDRYMVQCQTSLFTGDGDFGEAWLSRFFVVWPIADDRDEPCDRNLRDLLRTYLPGNGVGFGKSGDAHKVVLPDRSVTCGRCYKVFIGILR